MYCPYKRVGRDWKKLQHDGAIARMVIPLWELATWWRLVMRNVAHFADAVVD